MGAGGDLEHPRHGSDGAEAPARPDDRLDDGCDLPQMGARRVKTRTIGMSAAGLLAAVLAAAAGCETAPKVTTIHDTSVVRQAEARRLAEGAQKEQAAGNNEKAIQLYRQAVGASPELGFAWNNLGLLYMEKDNYLDAVEMFQNAADVMHGPQGAKPLY